MLRILSYYHFERSEKSSPVYTPHKISPHFVRRNDRPLQTVDDITGQAKRYPYAHHVVISSAARNLFSAASPPPVISSEARNLFPLSDVIAPSPSTGTGKISPHFVRRNDGPLQTADDITGQAKCYPYVHHVVISSAARNLFSAASPPPVISSEARNLFPLSGAFHHPQVQVLVRFLLTSFVEMTGHCRPPTISRDKRSVTLTSAMLSFRAQREIFSPLHPLHLSFRAKREIFFPFRVHSTIPKYRYW